jgi:hypothetical protein
MRGREREAREVRGRWVLLSRPVVRIDEWWRSRWVDDGEEDEGEEVR